MNLMSKFLTPKGIRQLGYIPEKPLKLDYNNLPI